MVEKEEKQAEICFSHIKYIHVLHFVYLLGIFDMNVWHTFPLVQLNILVYMCIIPLEVPSSSFRTIHTREEEEEKKTANQN